jgi:hypothetical protein
MLPRGMKVWQAYRLFLFLAATHGYAILFALFKPAQSVGQYFLMFPSLVLALDLILAIVFSFIAKVELLVIRFLTIEIFHQ